MSRFKREGISAGVHILSNCEVPKGGVITEEGILDNTIYTSTMCMESGSILLSYLRL